MKIFHFSRRYCWVCFATDEDDATAPWVKPCHCRGTAKWVHQRCIQRWVDEKQKGRSGAHVSCPQCNTEYIIVYPNMGKIFFVEITFVKKKVDYVVGISK